MNSYLTPSEGWLILAIFAVTMIGLVWFATRPHQSRDEHFVANRSVSTIRGAFSIAVSWIWAPAVFICSQKSYEQGMAGIFWFTFPNILCFFTFAPLAVRLRKLLPYGYSMPDFTWLRYRSKRTHLAFLTVTLGYDLGAIIINSLAGGLLLHSLAGIELRAGILSMSAVALSYAVWRAMPASIMTDLVQMTMILLIAFVLVPWAVSAAGGWHLVTSGLSGLNGSKNVFDPWIVYTFGIPTTLGLISGPVADQMFYQRVMSSRIDRIIRTFIVGGLVFGVVPIVLSIFGFVAASPALQAVLVVPDHQLVSVDVLTHFLPRWTLFLFTLMVLCALSSTLDSAYIALGSLISVDVYRRYYNPNASDERLIRVSKLSMLGFAFLGTAIAMLPGVKLLWVFLIYGALASAALVPTVLTLFWSRLRAEGAFWAIVLSVAFGLPLSIYANVTESKNLIVVAAIFSVAIGALVCIIDGLRNTGTRFEFRPVALTGSAAVEGV